MVDTNALLSHYDADVPVGHLVGWLALYLAVVHAITYLALRRAAARGARA